jgi:FkbM family methyltransferase
MARVRTSIAEFIEKQGARLSARLGPMARVVRLGRRFYSAAVGWIAADRGVKWSINGVEYRIDIRYRDRMAHEYESGVASFLSRLIQPGFVCFDVGANVGAYVLQLCHWAGPSGRVVAFEPNPEARKVLERHIAMNRFQPQVQIVPAAVGTGHNQTTLYAAAADGMSRLGIPNERLAGQTQALTVPMVTIDDFVQSGGAVPDVILIDVEGYELSVLKSASKAINERGGRLHIVVEMHPDTWQSAGTNLQEMSDFLREMKLRPKCLTGQRDPLQDYGLVYLESDPPAIGI